MFSPHPTGADDRLPRRGEPEEPAAPTPPSTSTEPERAAPTSPDVVSAVDADADAEADAKAEAERKRAARVAARKAAIPVGSRFDAVDGLRHESWEVLEVLGRNVFARTNAGKIKTFSVLFVVDRLRVAREQAAAAAAAAVAEPVAEADSTGSTPAE